MKRTLALVLALVMAIGLMAFPVSADFKDDAEIKYTEAVDVMSAMGVINGFEDGSFDPDGYLTREQAAKVVAYLMLGAEQADAMAATSAPFEDVAANRWSAGYIAYCVNEGIINGRSETTFDPTGNVTGYEFAKLMLGCLGYDSTIEQYTGAQWNINVAKTALTIGLFDGNKGANYNVALTREEAALYAFNMLQSDLVDYDNRGTVIELPGGGAISTGASKAESVLDYDNVDTIKDDAYLQFAERYFEDLEKDSANPDAFGRPATKWVYDKDEVGSYSGEPDFTYTSEVDGDDIYKDLGKPSASKTEYTYYEDGLKVNDFDGNTVGSNEDGIGGNGTLIEVYEVDPSADTYDEAYVVVVINTYVAEITDWIEADEDDDVEESVTIDAIGAAAAPDLTSNKFETTKFTEDDADDHIIVLYTVAAVDPEDVDDDYEIQSVDAAELVTATPTRYTAGKSFVAGGETYKYAANYDTDSEVSKTEVDADEDLDIYLDSYGYVIYTTATGGESDDYALIIALDKSTAAFEDNTDIAKILLATGEIVVADIDEDSKNVVSSIKNDVDGNKPVIVTYTVNKDGEYKIEKAEGQSVGTINEADEVLNITKGSARVKLNADTLTASSKTVFFVADDTVADSKDADYNAYVGYANVPSMSDRSSNDTWYCMVKSGNRIEAIFVANAKTSSTSSDAVIAVAFDKSETAQYDVDLGDYYEYEVVNGDSIETMMFAKDVVEEIFKASEDAIYLLDSISVDSDGIVTDLEIVPDDDNYGEGTGTERVKDDLVGLADGFYAYSDDCVVYKMNSDAEWSASSVNSIRTTEDDVSFIIDDDGIVTNIYILVK